LNFNLLYVQLNTISLFTKRATRQDIKLWRSTERLHYGSISNSDHQ